MYKIKEIYDLEIGDYVIILNPDQEPLIAEVESIDVENNTFTTDYYGLDVDQNPVAVVTE